LHGGARSKRSGSMKDFTATALNALAEAGYDVVCADIEPI
jgi:hypothetical protein